MGAGGRSRQPDLGAPSRGRRPTCSSTVELSTPQVENSTLGARGATLVLPQRRGVGYEHHSLGGYAAGGGVWGGGAGGGGGGAPFCRRGRGKGPHGGRGRAGGGGGPPAGPGG